MDSKQIEGAAARRPLRRSEIYRRQTEAAIHSIATEWPATMRNNLTHPDAIKAVAEHDPTTCRLCLSADKTG